MLDKKKFKRVTVDFYMEEYGDLRRHLEQIGKAKLGQNDFIRSAVKFAIAARLTEMVPAPRQKF